MHACARAGRNGIRPHHGGQQLGADPPEDKVPLGDFGSHGRLPAKRIEEGVVDHNLLQP